jgi:type I restriction enzyme S subunit
MLKSNSDLENLHYTPLYSLAEIMMGQSPDSKFVNDEQSGSPFLQGNGEFTTKYPKPIHWVTHPGKMAKKGDILISVRAPVGEINIADQDYCIGRGLAAIRFKNRIDPDYGWYAISFYKGQINRFAQGSTFLAVNSNDIRSIEIPMLEESEQLKIAEILTTVDDAIEQTEALIRKHQRIKQGLLQDLLTRGVDENGEIRGQNNHCFKNSEIGPIPYEWEVIDFEHLVNHITARWIPRNTGGSFPCLNLENIESETGQVNGFSDAIENSSTKTIFQKGDILFGKLRPYLKKYWIADVDGVCTTEILVFRAQSSIDHRYIYYLVQSEKFINYTISSSFGTKMPRTSWEIIKRYKIGKPTFEEQKRISKILFTIDSQIETSRVEFSKLNSLKLGLMQDLLTGKVRVDALLKN